MRVTRTVRDFQNALLILLEKNSFDHLTVDQICQEAMLHRSSFYRYFRDKYDLLEQTLNTKIGQIVESDESDDDIINDLVTYIDHNKDIFRHLAASSSHSSLYSEMLEILKKVMLDRAKKSSRDPLIMALQKADNPEMIAYTFAGSIIGAFYWWQKNNYNVPMEDVIEFTRTRAHAIANTNSHLPG